jgi:hypothetical protein
VLANRFSCAAFKSIPADQSATQGQECLVKVRPFFVAHAQSPALIQPSERPLDDPAPSAQSAAMFGVALRKKRDNASLTQTLPDRLGVITAVAQHAIRSMARTPTHALQGRDGINQCEVLLRVVSVGSGELDGQRNSASVANHMTLAAALRSVSGVGICLKPPKTARTELPSTTARGQSICP